MKEYKHLEFKTANEFRNWLEGNHNISQGINIVFYKKDSGKRTFSYPEALDEALCFGWIDSTVRRIDDEKYSQVFTPRSNTKNWSDVNKLKVLKLVEAGRMTEYGLIKIYEYSQTGKLSWTEADFLQNRKRVELDIPKYFLEALNSEPEAFVNFNKLASSHQRSYVEWIVDAKKEETRQRRTAKALQMLLNNMKPGTI
jgi:uncharacterized protein YdeI (YjbR/CyaY-like superfamily)